jgi:hypothetical protein
VSVGKDVGGHAALRRHEAVLVAAIFRHMALPIPTPLASGLPVA